MRTERRIVRVGAIAGLLAAVSGCGDSATSPMKADAAATLVDVEGKDVLLTVPTRREDGQEVLQIERVPAGTRVIVLEDAPVKAPVRRDLRLVKIRVDEGPKKGTVGGVNRLELRPSS